MPAAVTCTSCNRPLRVPESVLGQMVQCPLCLDEFIAQADPAAEAAARAAEAPAHRAAARPQAVTTQVRAGAEPGQPPLVEVEEEAVEVEPVLEAVAAAPAGRKAGPQRAFVFPVMVTRDPDRVLRGPMDGELTADGLYLRKMRQPPAFAAVGGRSRYLGGNRLVVTVEGREVELAVLKPRASTYHLARDTAAFLGGKGAFPNSRDYALPWYLYAMPALFVALPAAGIPLGLLTDGCLGAFLWVVIGLGLGGVTLAIAMQSWLRPRGRLIGAGGVLGLGAAVFLLALLFTPPYNVDASLWTPFSPSGGEFSVLMPGTPTVGTPNGVNGGQKYTVDITSPEIRFTVFVTPAPPQMVPGMGNNYQANTDATNLLNREYSLGYFGPWTQRDLSLRGQTYHEVLYQVPTGAYSVGQMAGKSLAARIFVVNGKVYTLAAMGPRVKLDAPDVVKFFNSVQFSASGPGVKPTPPAVETTTTGRVVKVDWGKVSVQPDAGAEKDFTIPDTARVIINGKDATARDIRVDSTATVTLDRDGRVAKVDVKSPAVVWPPPPPPPARLAPASPVGWKGLIAYWSFDDANGPALAVILDDTGNQVGTPLKVQSTDGKHGKALHFNGPGSSFDLSNADLNVPAQGEFTFAGWVRTRSASGVLLSLRNSLDPDAVVDLKLVNGQLTAVVWPDRKAVKDADFSGGAAINDGAWRHFALTRRRDGTAELFIDGASRVSHIAQKTNGPITTDMRALGHERYWAEVGGNFANEDADFIGDIDEFCAFNRALTPDEVRKLAGVAGP